MADDIRVPVIGLSRPPEVQTGRPFSGRRRSGARATVALSTARVLPDWGFVDGIGG